MSSLSNKIDFAVILRVNHANPNGDPLNGNRPRTDYSGLGEISDVCLKRKLRDRLQESGAAIFVQSDDRKNDDATSLQDRAIKGLGKDFGGPETAKKASEKWFDVRAFGQLFAMKSSKKKADSESDSAGDIGVSIPIRGPVIVLGRRAPRGARGLKLSRGKNVQSTRESRPTRGAWIETRTISRRNRSGVSRPTRGAWIETSRFNRARSRSAVAPHAGRVD